MRRLPQITSTNTNTAQLKLAVQGGGDKRPKNWGEYFCPDCPAGVPLVGKSYEMRKTLETIRRVAQSRCNPVLIVGESGTGKELAARAVHAWRGGNEENFVAINCAALTANLLESELFGHVRGSFTGADREKTGLFAAAGEGTIFLDEISEMPMGLQAKLLRVLQERKFRKVGGTRDISCRATVITSSNQDLLAGVRHNRFRKDLYYRLAVFPIHMPTLRSAGRRSDILLLAKYFLQTSEICRHDEINGISSEAEQLLLRHDWPGNVRELRNIIDRAVIVETGKRIDSQSILIDRLEGGPTARQGSGEGDDLSLATAEREFITRALKETGWQRTRAASLLGITRATLHSKLKRYGIKPPGSEQAAPNLPVEEENLREACA